MPELRSGVRRGRAHRNPNAIRIEDQSVIAVRTRPRRAAQNRRGEVVVDGGERDTLRGLGLQATSFEEEEVKVLGATGGGSGPPREEVAEKEMDEYDSGGRSGDKGPGAEDEGSTAPLPEKVDE